MEKQAATVRVIRWDELGWAVEEDRSTAASLP